VASKKKPSKGSNPEAETTTDQVSDQHKQDETEVPAPVVSEELESAVAESDLSDDTDQPEEDTPEDAADTSPGTPEPIETPEPDLQSQVESSGRSNGFGGLVLGGVVAAFLGAAATYFLVPNLGAPAFEDSEGFRAIEVRLSEHTKTLESQASRIEELTELSARPVSEHTHEKLSEMIAQINDRLLQIDARLTDLESRPVASADTGRASSSEYDVELQALKNTLAAQEAQLAAISDAAAQQDAAANLSARATLQRAALTRIQTALDSGATFTSALADLEATGVEAPNTLVRAAGTGVPTLSELEQSFPDAARAALSVARAQSQSDGGVWGFINAQLGVRSLEAREGNDPDAVLSRTEAALKEGRLTDALAEIESLPETARSELSDWAGAATIRLDVLSEFEALGAKLN